MGLFDFLWKKKEIAQITDNDRQQFTDDMSANANLLVKQFKDDAKLDFTIESLREVDIIIKDSIVFYKKADSETKRKMIIKIGAYVFEVARKKFGGQYYWYNRLDQPILVTGQPEFEMSFLAYEKVRGCFENGKQNEISLVFEDYAVGIANKSTLMIV